MRKLAVTLIFLKSFHVNSVYTIFKKHNDIHKRFLYFKLSKYLEKNYSNKSAISIA